MRGKVAKRIHKYSRRQFMEYVRMIEKWPFEARLRFAWHILKPRGVTWQTSIRELFRSILHR